METPHSWNIYKFLWTLLYVWVCGSWRKPDDDGRDSFPLLSRLSRPMGNEQWESDEREKRMEERKHRPSGEIAGSIDFDPTGTHKVTDWCEFLLSTDLESSGRQSRFILDVCWTMVASKQSRHVSSQVDPGAPRALMSTRPRRDSRGWIAQSKLNKPPVLLLFFVRFICGGRPCQSGFSRPHPSLNDLDPF